MNPTIVVDTSIVVSALIGKRGPSREVIRKCLTGEYNPLMSNPLFQEIEDVIAREKIKALTPLTTKEIRAFVNAFYSTSKWVPIYFLWRPNLLDEGDNFLIELAIAGNASVIVMNNIKDLHGAQLVFNELQIMKPEQILRED
ncbi:putative toxin-antitoxin system toxin component, PIN family [Chromatiales bacterium (ex Bugula neritina AB1)]|nr:putative toxin-antitoxin system toxin component, PIN family [Chromatiales bacterium (ex Bugula neritina AB1)]